MREFASWPIALLLAKIASLLAKCSTLSESRCLAKIDKVSKKSCKQRGKAASGEHTTIAPRSRANRAHNCRTQHRVIELISDQ